MAATEEPQKLVIPTITRVIRTYWCGFDVDGKEKWYMELSNGQVIGEQDPNWGFWMRKYRPSYINDRYVSHRPRRGV